METAVTTLIKDQLQKAIRALYGVELDAIEVEHPQNPAWGDYASNVALINAKQLGKAAPVLAEELIAYLTKTLPKETFNSVSAAGPGFINFTLTRSFYLQKMFRVLTEKSDFGRTDLGHGKRVTLEHSNVNPNKAAHIGHMRNAVIGQFLERAYKFIGYDVTVQYYANDLGVQVSTSLLGVKKLADKYNEKNYRKFDHYMWDIYAKISSLLENDPALKQELAKQMLKLEEREPQISKEQDLLAKKVLQDNLQTFASLDIDYDLIIFESCIKDMKMWEKTFEQLKGNENIYLATTGASQGCWLLRMAGKEGSPGIEKDKIIVRANGIPTYTAKDIAYHMWKFGLLAEDFEYKISSLGQQSRPLYETSIQGNVEKAFTPSELVLDVIDVRQTYAIDAVRAALVYLGYDQQAANLIHINYGHVYLSKDTATKLGYESAENTGQIAMSGRKGVGIKIDDFLELVDQSLTEAHGDFPNRHHIRNAAIKFDMLRYDTFQDVIFDVTATLNYKGFTGPYIQYTHARANSLLTKADYQPDLNQVEQLTALMQTLVPTDPALAVVRLLYKFPETVIDAALKYAPNLLCVYLYELCQAYNSFYNGSPVLQAETSKLKQFRLLVTAATKQVIANGLYLLGITAVDKM